MTDPVKYVREWLSRRSSGIRRLVFLGPLLVVTFSVLWFTPTPYYITAPGAAIDSRRIVEVKDGKEHDGHLLMLILTTQPANLFWYLYARVDSRSVLETKEQFLGQIQDYEKYVELTRQMMADSQLSSKAVALQVLGYGHGVRSAGVRVLDLTTGSPANGHLQKGDVIMEAGGLPVRSTADLTAITRAVPAGTPLPVRLRRDAQELAITVPTGEHPDPDRKGTAAFGIFPKDELTFDIPIPVQIKAGPITGPSAGMIFTLQIIHQLSPGGITGGAVVAGTGTIEPDGRVGQIGGVQQKVYTAEAAGASVMFVPRANYDAAKHVATRIEVVPVDHVRDAVEWLQKNRKKAGHTNPAFWS